jgi:hypothetical protein
MRPPVFSPPYDSPIEEIFAREFSRWASSLVDLQSQVHVQTVCGLFILDFVIISPDGVRIAVECDGKEFHEESRDEWRDAMILGGDHVDEVFRLRGADIHYRIDDLIHLLSIIHPDLFDERTRLGISGMASQAALDARICADDSIYTIRYPNEFRDAFLRMEVRKKEVVEGTRPFWLTAYQFALEHAPVGIDDIISLYRSKFSL